MSSAEKDVIKDCAESARTLSTEEGTILAILRSFIGSLEPQGYSDSLETFILLRQRLAEEPTSLRERYDSLVSNDTRVTVCS